MEKERADIANKASLIIQREEIQKISIYSQTPDQYKQSLVDIKHNSTMREKILTRMRNQFARSKVGFEFNLKKKGIYLDTFNKEAARKIRRGFPEFPLFEKSPLIENNKRKTKGLIKSAIKETKNLQKSTIVSMRRDNRHPSFLNSFLSRSFGQNGEVTFTPDIVPNDSFLSSICRIEKKLRSKSNSFRSSATTIIPSETNLRSLEGKYFVLPKITLFHANHL